MEFLPHVILVGIMLFFGIISTKSYSNLNKHVLTLHIRISLLETDLKQLKLGKNWGNISGEYDRHGKINE